jgi:hypothetical protein
MTIIENNRKEKKVANKNEGIGVRVRIQYLKSARH